MSDLIVPPQADEAEQSVLGACLLSPGAIAACEEILRPQDFYRPSHGLIFRAILDVGAAGTPVDAITVVDELERRGQLEQAGGRTHVYELAALVPSTANASHYARIVSEMAQLRSLMACGQEGIRLAIERPGDVENLLDQFQQRALGLTELGTREELSPLRDSVLEQFRRVRELAERGGGLVGVSSGLRGLDELTCGFEPGNLIVVGARPSLGKSALALGFVRHLALREKLPVGVFSLEMSRMEVTQRLLAAESGVSLKRLRLGEIRLSEWTAIANASERIAEAPLFVDEHGSCTPAQVRAGLRRLRQRQPQLALAVVDYLQLMDVERSRERRDLELGDVTRSLKQTAKSCGVPLVLLSQLNRESERRADRRPALADLRDSGATEADADIVILLHRRDDEMVLAIVAKNRNGPLGDVPLLWRGDTTRFQDVEP